jgi:lipopolysaccharide/colanic/teichoic acid biosynthesis glycosyltransferase
MPIIKRLSDILFSLTLLLILFPVVVLFSIFNLCFLGSPIFFTQERLGRDGLSFRIIKFKSMVNDKPGENTPDNERLTKYGKFLRSSSIDELPELLNVLSGDMSLVGPRPLPVKYRERFTKEQFRRHTVRPGITGWAQINGRNSISWPEKFTLDLWYIDNHSLWLDFKILILTVWRVIERRGISAENSATMPEFKGSESD